MFPHPFYIHNDEFRVHAPNCVDLIKSEDGDDSYDSHRIKGVPTTIRKDRQGEDVIAKGLDFGYFLEHGCFNDNHNQSTAGLIGYPTKAYYTEDLKMPDGTITKGWVTEGYLLKGYEPADNIWNLAKALQDVPTRRLGFSIEGKVLERDKLTKTIKKAMIRAVAITNCPVNTDCTWDVLAKSFYDEDIAMKSLSAGYGAALGPSGQSGGSALSPESLDKDKKKKKKLKVLMRSMGIPDIDDFEKAYDYVKEARPNYTDEAAVAFVQHYLKGVAA